MNQFSIFKQKKISKKSIKIYNSLLIFVKYMINILKYGINEINNKLFILCLNLIFSNIRIQDVFVYLKFETICE